MLYKGVLLLGQEPTSPCRHGVHECRSLKSCSQTSSLLSVDRKREVSKLNVGVVLIIAIREISNRENEFDVNSRNIRPSKITRYTVCNMGY